MSMSNKFINSKLNYGRTYTDTPTRKLSLPYWGDSNTGEPWQIILKAKYCENSGSKYGYYITTTTTSTSASSGNGDDDTTDETTSGPDATDEDGKTDSGTGQTTASPDSGSDTRTDSDSTTTTTTTIYLGDWKFDYPVPTHPTTGQVKYCTPTLVSQEQSIYLNECKEKCQNDDLCQGILFKHDTTTSLYPKCQGVWNMGQDCYKQWHIPLAENLERQQQYAGTDAAAACQNDQEWCYYNKHAEIERLEEQIQALDNGGSNADDNQAAGDGTSDSSNQDAQTGSGVLPVTSDSGGSSSGSTTTQTTTPEPVVIQLVKQTLQFTMILADTVTAEQMMLASKFRSALQTGLATGLGVQDIKPSNITISWISFNGKGTTTAGSSTAVARTTGDSTAVGGTLGVRKRRLKRMKEFEMKRRWMMSMSNTNSTKRHLQTATAAGSTQSIKTRGVNIEYLVNTTYNSQVLELRYKSLRMSNTDSSSSSQNTNTTMSESEFLLNELTNQIDDYRSVVLDGNGGANEFMVWVPITTSLSMNDDGVVATYADISGLSNLPGNSGAGSSSGSANTVTFSGISDNICGGLSVVNNQINSITGELKKGPTDYNLYYMYECNCTDFSNAYNYTSCCSTSQDSIVDYSEDTTNYYNKCFASSCALLRKVEFDFEQKEAYRRTSCRPTLGCSDLYDSENCESNRKCVWGKGDESFGEFVQPGWYTPIPVNFQPTLGTTARKMGDMITLESLSVTFGQSDYANLRNSHATNTRKNPSSLSQCKPAHSEFIICENILSEQSCVKITGCSWVPDWLVTPQKQRTYGIFPSRCISSGGTKTGESCGAVKSFIQSGYFEKGLNGVDGGSENSLATYPVQDPESGSTDDEFQMSEKDLCTTFSTCVWDPNGGLNGNGECVSPYSQLQKAFETCFGIRNQFSCELELSTVPSGYRCFWNHRLSHCEPGRGCEIQSLQSGSMGMLSNCTGEIQKPNTYCQQSCDAGQGSVSQIQNVTRQVRVCSSLGPENFDWEVPFHLQNQVLIPTTTTGNVPGTTPINPDYANSLDQNLICGAQSPISCQAGQKPILSPQTGLPLGPGQCELCPPGSYSLKDAASCTLCPKGYYQNLAGQSNCLPCDDGFSPIRGSTSCIKCPINSYFSKNANGGRGGSGSKTQSEDPTLMEGELMAVGVSADDTATSSDQQDAVLTGVVESAEAISVESACRSCPDHTFSAQYGAKGISVCSEMWCRDGVACEWSKRKVETNQEIALADHVDLSQSDHDSFNDLVRVIESAGVTVGGNSKNQNQQQQSAISSLLVTPAWYYFPRTPLLQPGYYGQEVSPFINQNKRTNPSKDYIPVNTVSVTSAIISKLITAGSTYNTVATGQQNQNEDFTNAQLTAQLASINNSPKKLVFRGWKVFQCVDDRTCLGSKLVVDSGNSNRPNDQWQANKYASEKTEEAIENQDNVALQTTLAPGQDAPLPPLYSNPLKRQNTCALKRKGLACSECERGWHRSNSQNSGPCIKCDDNSLDSISGRYGSSSDGSEDDNTSSNDSDSVNTGSLNALHKIIIVMTVIAIILGSLIAYIVVKVWATGEARKTAQVLLKQGKVIVERKKRRDKLRAMKQFKQSKFGKPNLNPVPDVSVWSDPIQDKLIRDDNVRRCDLVHEITINSQNVDDSPKVQGKYTTIDPYIEQHSENDGPDSDEAHHTIMNVDGDDDDNKNSSISNRTPPPKVKRNSMEIDIMEEGNHNKADAESIPDNTVEVQGIDNNDSDNIENIHRTHLPIASAPRSTNSNDSEINNDQINNPRNNPALLISSPETQILQNTANAAQRLSLNSSLDSHLGAALIPDVQEFTNGVYSFIQETESGNIEKNANLLLDWFKDLNVLKNATNGDGDLFGLDFSDFQDELGGEIQAYTDEQNVMPGGNEESDNAVGSVGSSIKNCCCGLIKSSGCNGFINSLGSSVDIVLSKLFCRALQAYAVMFTFSFDLPQLNIWFFEIPEVLKLSFDVPSIECELRGFSSYVLQNACSPWVLLLFGLFAFGVYRLCVFALLQSPTNLEAVGGVEGQNLLPTSIWAFLRFFSRFYMLFFLVIAKKTFSYFECMRHPGFVRSTDPDMTVVNDLTASGYMYNWLDKGLEEQSLEDLDSNSYSDNGTLNLEGNDYPEFRTHRVFRHIQCYEGRHGEMLLIAIGFVILNVLAPLLLVFFIYNKLSQLLRSNTSQIMKQVMKKESQSYRNGLRSPSEGGDITRDNLDSATDLETDTESVKTGPGNTKKGLKSASKSNPNPQQALRMAMLHNSKKAINLERNFHFLWHDYRGGCSYFILFLLTKDMLFPLAGIFFDDGFRQSLFASLVLFFYLLSVVKLQPFREYYVNTVEILLVGFQLAILLISGFSFDRTEGNTSSKRGDDDSTDSLTSSDTMSMNGSDDTIATVAAPSASNASSGESAVERKERIDYRNRRALVLFILQISAIVVPLWIVVGGRLITATFSKPEIEPVVDENEKKQIQKQLQNLHSGNSTNGQDNINEHPDEILATYRLKTTEKNSRFKCSIRSFLSFFRTYFFPYIESAHELRDEILTYIFILNAGPLHQWIPRLQRMEHTQLRQLAKGFRDVLVAGTGSRQGELLKVSGFLGSVQRGRQFNFEVRRLEGLQGGRLLPHEHSADGSSSLGPTTNQNKVQHADSTKSSQEVYMQQVENENNVNPSMGLNTPNTLNKASYSKSLSRDFKALFVASSNINNVNNDNKFGNSNVTKTSTGKESDSVTNLNSYDIDQQDVGNKPAPSGCVISGMGLGGDTQPCVENLLRLRSVCGRGGPGPGNKKEIHVKRAGFFPASPMGSRIMK